MEQASQKKESYTIDRIVDGSLGVLLSTVSVAGAYGIYSIIVEERPDTSLAPFCGVLLGLCYAVLPGVVSAIQLENAFNPKTDYAEIRRSDDLDY